MLRKSLFAAIALGIPLGADAFVPFPRPMPCMLYFLSDAVFIGQVTSAKDEDVTEGGGNFTEGWDYTLRVIKNYRGADGPDIQVHTENDSGRLPLVVGKKYILFAQREGGRLAIAYDSLSGELKDSKQVLAELDKIMARKAGEGGDVYGRITVESFGAHDGGVGGIHVSIEGAAGHAHAVTNANGWFQVHLPAGTYSAVASDPKWSFKNMPDTWENSSSFQVPDGGCAEIQIQAGNSASPSSQRK